MQQANFVSLSRFAVDKKKKKKKIMTIPKLFGSHKNTINAYLYFGTFAKTFDSPLAGVYVNNLKSSKAFDMFFNIASTKLWSSNYLKFNFYNKILNFKN